MSPTSSSRKVRSGRAAETTRWNPFRPPKLFFELTSPQTTGTLPVRLTTRRLNSALPGSLSRSLIASFAFAIQPSFFSSSSRPAFRAALMSSLSIVLVAGCDVAAGVTPCGVASIPNAINTPPAAAAITPFAFGCRPVPAGESWAPSEGEVLGVRTVHAKLMSPPTRRQAPIPTDSADNSTSIYNDGYNLPEYDHNRNTWSTVGLRENSSSMETDFATELGSRLAAAREKKGISQEVLAAKANISPQSVSNYERARSVPTLPILLKLAAALDAPISQLVDKMHQHPPLRTARYEDETAILRMLNGLSDAQVRTVRALVETLNKQSWGNELVRVRHRPRPGK